MTRRALDPNCNLRYRDLDAHFDNHPNLIEKKQKNATVKYVGPHGEVWYHDHPSQDVPRGTLRSICRMAALAGLALVCLAIAAALLPLPL